MVEFLHKRLQVFISSTYKDLLSERQAAVEAILTAGHIPAGMELFTSGDESQMEVIKQWIDESDVYLLILGGRYGSIEPTSGKSYIQLEYEYAANQSKPLFSCVINTNALEIKVKNSGSSVIETDNSSQLKTFRELVSKKMVRFWDDEKDIKIAVGETLSHFARREDLLGWVRPQQEANMPALADEITRLSKENALLRSKVETNREEHNIHGLSFSELTQLLKKEGVFDFLLDKKEKLSSSFNANGFVSARDIPYLRKLCLFGLLTQEETNVYKMTDECRVYLNRLSLMDIENEGDSDNDK